MATLGKCEICGRASEELFTCRICGRRVCKRHYRDSREICIACEEALCEVCGRKLSIGYCSKCGRLVCEDCSVEIGPALLCIECHRKVHPTP